MTTETEESDDPSGGTQNLDGLEYQIQVSVWAALALLLDKRLAPSMVVEPVSQEDIEADITDGDGPGVVATRTEILSNTPYRLVIQAKLRSTEPWSIEDLRSLLKHGKRRISAAKRLDDPHIRYLLVTNADLKGVARQIRVSVLGAWPTDPLPVSLKSDVPSTAKGRLAVLCGHDPERLEWKIRELLEDTFLVPHTRLENCKQALAAEVRERMQGVGGGVWLRENLEAIVRRHEGYLASSPEADSFVRPKNWAALEATLREQNAIVLLGASGTGKSTAARVMIDNLRKEIPGLNVVWITHGPQEVVAPRPEGPVAFFIEDPWGQYRFEPSFRSWNEAFGRLLPTARGNRRFIVTSRSDVLEDAGGTTLPSKYLQSLESEHYGPSERLQMYEQREARLPWRLRPPVAHHREAVLESLLSPLEIQKFFDAVGAGPHADEDEESFVNRCINEAHRDTIETTLVLQVNAREGWQWAAIVWGLFKARPNFSREMIPRIEAALASGGREYEDGLESFIRFLVAGHNLRQIESDIRYSHPRVEAGLEQAMKAKPVRAARALVQFMDVLIGIDSLDDWGLESTASVLRATKHLAGLYIQPSTYTQSTLDTWLASRLSASPDQFRVVLPLAAEIGSKASECAELARWLLHTTPPADSWFSGWSFPQRSAEWYQRIASAPLTPRICELFIKNSLVFDWIHYPDKFAEHVKLFKVQLAKAFLEVAADILRQSYHWNASVIACGCAEDLDGFESIAITASEIIQARDKNMYEESNLKLLNGEYDEEHADHLSEPDDKANAETLVNTYVDTLRNKRGWDALRRYAARSPFRQAWISTLAVKRECSEDEALGLLTVVWGTAEEAAFWTHLTDYWCPSLSSRLEERIRVGHPDRNTRIAAIVCLARHIPQVMVSVNKSLCQASTWRRILELAQDLHDAHEIVKNERAVIEAVSFRFTSDLPLPIRTAAGALLSPGALLALDADSVALVGTIDMGENRASRLAQARLLAASGRDIKPHLDALLNVQGNSSDDIQFAAQAVRLAANRGFWSVVERSLHHRFADVRQSAMEVLAASTRDGPLPPPILALATDKGSRVRFSLIALLSARRHQDHVDALVTLAGDSWSRFTRRHADESAEYPIARAAAALLTEPPELPERIYTKIIHLINNTDDYVVIQDLFLALVRNASIDVRGNVVKFVATSHSGFLRAAAWALVQAADHVDEMMANAITSDRLQQCPPRVAPLLAVLVGRRAAADHIVAIARALSGNMKRRVLTVPLIIAAVRRDAGLLDLLVGFLPSDRARIVKEALINGKMIPREVLNELGEVHLVDEVLRLPDLFDP